MTRASLLHILNHVGGISEAEIRELEQLAAAFPYCQTAHVLLAKAAHDQGSMLASQRLRRAATYAADRQLLRQLLESPAPETFPVDVAAPRELAAPATAATSGSTAFFQALVTEDVQLLDLQEEVTMAEEEVQPEAASAPEIIGLLPPAAETETAAHPGADSALVANAPVESESAEFINQPFVEPLASLEVSDEAAETVSVSTAEPDDPEPAPLLSSAVAEDEDGTPASASAPTVASEADPDELLPAVAPLIRPPAGTGTSRFEFGLSEPDVPPVAILYQLPDLEEDEKAAVYEEIGPLPATVPTTALAAPFRADADLAYALLAGGSRFGYALQLRDEELTCSLPATEFFPPDALLHAHAGSHLLQPVPAPSSFDLINRFLKVQPRLKSPGALPPVQEQADLAARSTHAPPALGSESLAKILIKQGKTGRAIEIYEQLMVRQPEKSAYFAGQIQQLKTPE